MDDTAKRILKQWLPLIAAAVALFALLNNLGSVTAFISGALTVLSPILIGGAIALILNVPLRGIKHIIIKLDRKHKISVAWRTRLSLILTFVLTPVVVAAVFLFFVPQFTSAVSDFINLITENQSEIAAFLERFGINSESVNGIIRKLTSVIDDNIAAIAGGVLSTAVSLFSFVTSAIMIVMLAIYLLIDKKRLSRQCQMTLLAMLPVKLAAYLIKVWRLFVDMFSKFISSQVLEALILGCMLFLAMTAFQLPYALSICSLTVVMALIPYLGAFMSMGVGVLMILLIDPTKALVFTGVFLVVQQIEGNIIYPRVVGDSVGLPAYLTLIAVSVGGALMGIAGMMLFVPVVSVVYKLTGEAVAIRLAKKKAAREITETDICA